MMKPLIRTMTLENLEEIRSFEKDLQAELIEDEMEREIQSWNARWRQESLEHYLKQGWSFMVRDENDTCDEAPDGRLLGYYLAQPLLFFEGQTQSLWIEHLSYLNEEVRDLLVDTAYKMAREKHLQKLLISESQKHGGNLHSKAEPWSGEVTVLPTTKS